MAPFLPDTVRDWVQGIIREGMAAMKTTLDAQRGAARPPLSAGRAYGACVGRQISPGTVVAI